MILPHATARSSTSCIQQHEYQNSYDIRPCPGSSIIDTPLACAQGCKSQMYYRGGGLLPAHPGLRAISWNVEGLTDDKLEVLQVYMAQMKVGIIALQETHTCNSDYFVTLRATWLYCQAQQATTMILQASDSLWRRD